MGRLPGIRIRQHSRAGLRAQMRRMVLTWLAAQSPAPTGCACEVPTRGNRSNLVDVAAFWSATRRRQGRAFQLPVRTALVLCVLSREECWNAGANPEELYRELAECHAALPSLEARIRAEDPELRDDYMLFEEYAVWNYDRARNPEYQRLRLRCQFLEEELFRGTRMERIGRSDCADELYLAAPEGCVTAAQVMPGWGVLSVSNDGKTPITLLRPAEPQRCLPEARLQLVQAIAAAASDFVLAGYGTRHWPRL